MHSKQLMSAGLITSTILGLLVGTPLYSQSAKCTSIQYGPGILYCCKCVFFGTRGVDRPIKVNAEDPQFRAVIVWIGKNVFSKLNSEHVTSFKTANADTQFALTLWNREMPVTHYRGPELGDSLMLTIPLNEETLGTRYEEAAIELRDLMKKIPKD